MIARWGGGFDDFALHIVESSRPEEIERALRFGWYLHRVEKCPEFTASEIAELFQRAHISKPNVTRLAERLAKTQRTFRGSTPGRFRLTAGTLAELDEEFPGAFEDERPAAVSGLVLKLEAKLVSLLDSQVRSFVQEAVNCFRAGHLRAAVVLSWIGAVAVLQNYVASNYLAAFNSDAKSNGFLKRDARGASEFSKIKEADFLDSSERIGVLSNAVKKELKVCLERRNNCGHPNDYIVTETAVAAHVESLIVHVFERY
jgi:hypothetical protein